MLKKYGWLYGLLVNFTVTEIFKKMMHKLFNYEPMNNIDRIFTIEDPKVFLPNILCCGFFDKFEYEQMKNHFLKKTETINRM